MGFDARGAYGLEVCLMPQLAVAAVAVFSTLTAVTAVSSTIGGSVSLDSSLDRDGLSQRQCYLREDLDVGANAARLG